MIARAIDGRFLDHPFFFFTKKNGHGNGCCQRPNSYNPIFFMYLCRAPPLSRWLCRGPALSVSARVLSVSGAGANCDLRSGPRLPPVRCAICVPPIWSAGPQLRSACQPSSKARSLFPGEKPKPYCLGENLVVTPKATAVVFRRRLCVFATSWKHRGLHALLHASLS